MNHEYEAMEELVEVEVAELDLREDLIGFSLPCCGCGNLWSNGS